MATRPKFTCLAHYSCECVEASHIFFLPLANVGESGESEQNRLENVGESSESEQNRLANVGESGESEQNRLANVGESGESEQNRLANVGKSGESEQNRLANVGESGESEQTRLANVGESGTFLKKAILASTQICQKWRISGEYSNLINSLSSGHCLQLIQSNCNT
jgi:hypothetical protein